MTPENETYLKWHKQSGFAVGDEVEILRQPFDLEMGWGNNRPTHDPSRFVSEKTKITRDGGLGGFELASGFFWPYFVLRLVKKAALVKKVEISSQCTAEVSESGIKVGCTTFTHDKLAVLYFVSREVCGGKKTEPVAPCKWRKLSDEEYIKEGDVFTFNEEVSDACENWNKAPYSKDGIVRVGRTLAEAKGEHEGAVVARKI